MKNFENKLLLAFLIVAMCGFAMGYAIGIREAGRHAVAFMECDTDTDCLEKNGCGGYADPCTEGAVLQKRGNGLRFR